MRKMKCGFPKMEVKWNVKNSNQIYGKILSAKPKSPIGIIFLVSSDLMSKLWIIAFAETTTTRTMSNLTRCCIDKY